jgi:hypothetical protein
MDTNRLLETMSTITAKRMLKSPDKHANDLTWVFGAQTSGSQLKYMQTNKSIFTSSTRQHHKLNSSNTSEFPFIVSLYIIRCRFNVVNMQDIHTNGLRSLKLLKIGESHVMKS